LARALVLEAPRQLVPRELPLPAIGDDDGLLRVEACAAAKHAARARTSGVGDLLPVMAGEGEVPPVHAVVVPEPGGRRG
jgi:alcohol dehydrogenase